jgi:hypothetical protein
MRGFVEVAGGHRVAVQQPADQRTTVPSSASAHLVGAQQRIAGPRRSMSEPGGDEPVGTNLSNAALYADHRELGRRPTLVVADDVVGGELRSSAND